MTLLEQAKKVVELADEGWREGTYLEVALARALLEAREQLTDAWSVKMQKRADGFEDLNRALRTELAEVRATAERRLGLYEAAVKRADAARADSERLDWWCENPEATVMQLGDGMWEVHLNGTWIRETRSEAIDAAREALADEL